MTEVSVDRERVLQASAHGREIASTLRALSSAARAHSSVLRRHNRQARNRADRLRASVRLGADTRGVALLDLPPTTISTRDLVQILVTHHRWTRFQAQMVLAVEMELGGVPVAVSELDSSDALDLLGRVLARGPS